MQIAPLRLLPPCGEGQRREVAALRNKRAMAHSIISPEGRDPPPLPAPARGGGCANVTGSTLMQQALGRLIPRDQAQRDSPLVSREGHLKAVRKRIAQMAPSRTPVHRYLR